MYGIYGWRMNNMKFTREHCPKCLNNDLEVLGSKIINNYPVAHGFIDFECKECGHVFQVRKDAIVEAYNGKPEEEV